MDEKKVTEIILDPVFQNHDYDVQAEQIWEVRKGLEYRIHLTPIIASGAGLALVLSMLVNSDFDPIIMSGLVPSAWLLLIAITFSYLNLVMISRSATNLERYHRKMNGIQITFLNIRSKVNYDDPNLAKIAYEQLDETYRRQIDEIVQNSSQASDLDVNYQRCERAAIGFFWVSIIAFFAAIIVPLATVSSNLHFWFQQ